MIACDSDDSLAANVETSKMSIKPELQCADWQPSLDPATKPCNDPAFVCNRSAIIAVQMILSGSTKESMDGNWVKKRKPETTVVALIRQSIGSVLPALLRALRVRH